MMFCLKWPRLQLQEGENKMLRVSSSFSENTRTIQKSIRGIYDPSNTDQILIVGGGICALWFALHFHQFSPTTNIIILERRAVVRDQYYVTIDPTIFKTYIGFENVLGRSFMLSDLYQHLLEYSENIDCIQVMNDSDQRSIAEYAHKAVFIMDGAARSFSNTIFTETVMENAEYFVEIQYLTKFESTALTAGLQQSICAIFGDVYVQEIVSGIHVVLRVDISYSDYVKGSENKGKGFVGIQPTPRKIINYWLHARQRITNETVLGKVNLSYFAFPIFHRSQFALYRRVPYFVLGAAAFQSSLANGLSRCMDMAATVAPLFVKDITTLMGEYNYVCETFLQKAVERKVVVKEDDQSYILDHSGAWENDFF